MPNFAAFMSLVLISTFTPGPNNIMSMSNASRYGFRRSIKFNIGIFFGFFIIMALSALFSVSLYSLIPSVKPVMTVIGAIYILWLAWKTFRSQPHGTAVSKQSEAGFLSGFLLQFVNPKVIIYGITIISTFIVPHYRSVAVIAGFCAFLALVGFTATSCWALFGSAFQKALQKNEKLINVIMALLLVYCAVSLFFE